MAALRKKMTVAAKVALVLFVGFFVSVSFARTESFDCAHEHCGLLSNGDYRNLIIGRLVRVGTDAQMERVYHWAKAHGYWQSLPDSPAPYLRDVKLVSIALPSSVVKQPVTVFIETAEYDPAQFKPGTLVRYSPHGTRHEAPPHSGKAGLALFHGLTGCVATLCGLHDTACASHYRQGVYTKAHGRPVDLQTGAIIPGGVVIDPVSLMPRPNQKQTPQGP